MKNKRNIFLVVLLYSSLQCPAFAHTDRHSVTPPLPELQAKTWYRLLHFTADGTRSEIENSSFFLAENGRYDPKAELDATLEAFQSSELAELDTHPVCRFPARALFLRQSGFSLPDPESLCPSFSQWHGDLQDNALSLVYADGYLGNPASFYGHILFKISAPNAAQDLLTNSLNFGARVPDKENPVLYILKGLVGGYDATYSSNHYYRYNLNYTEVEMRDLWQYQLNLKADEKALLVAHAWEMLSTQYTYYFTNRNCAYHVARLLEVVLQERLVDEKDPFVLPISVFAALSMANTQSGQPAIAQISRKPSRQARFREHFSTLSVSGKKAIQDYLATLDMQSIHALEFSEAIQVFDVLFDYIEFRLVMEGDNLPLLHMKRTLQQSRIKLPIGSPSWPNQIQKAPPHTGHKPTLLRTKVGSNNLEGTFLQLDFRPAYYDLLSQGDGILKNSALSMLETNVRIDQHGTHLQKLDLLNIETTDTTASGLPGDNGIAWKLRVGNERDTLANLAPSNEFFAESGMGKGLEWSNITVYSMLTGRIQTPDISESRFLLIPSVTVLANWAGVKSACQFSYPLRLGATYYQRALKSQCELSAFASQTLDFRLSLAHQVYTELSLGVSWYF
jgi:hypothetical protein